MENKVNPGTITLIISVPILLLILIGILFYINLSKTIEIIGTISYKNKTYIIVKDDNSKNEYKIKTNTENYNLKDQVKIKLYKINNNSDPKEASIKSISIINKNNNKIADSNEDNIENYFHELDNDLNNYNDDKTIIETIKTNYVNIVDFMFYDKEINNKKFNELTASTKLKLLKIAISIDNKMNKILPEYKENIPEDYKNIKSKIVEKYLNLTEEICNQEEEACLEAKKDLKELKGNLYISWNYIKNISGIDTEKLKQWNEIWREI